LKSWRLLPWVPPTEGTFSVPTAGWPLPSCFLPLATINPTASPACRRPAPAPRRKFERFFEHFHEYDNIVIATFPTCHDPTFRELLSLGLPQRYLALVHNPEYLNSTGVVDLLRAGDVRLLTISPHVGAYAREILEAQGAGDIQQDWIAPMMPVIYPEDCAPGSWQEVHPACDRAQRWQTAEPPRAVLTGSRDSFCIQGKVDPARRNYEAIFAELAAHRAELAAANLSVTILGKAGGRKNKVLLELPQDLVEAGLLRHYPSLPFQVRGGVCAGGGRGWAG
jgi:hypothetical protein